MNYYFIIIIIFIYYFLIIFFIICYEKSLELHITFVNNRIRKILLIMLIVYIKLLQKISNFYKVDIVL